MKQFLFILAVLILTSCNKNKTGSFVVDGQVKNYTTGSGEANVQIQVFEVSASGVNSGSVLIETAYSKADGSYSIEFQRNLVEEYDFVFSKSNFFTQTIVKNFDALSTQNENLINLSLKPAGWIQFQIKNNAPGVAGDQLKIYKEEDEEFCSDCCPYGYYYFDGANVDETWTCGSIADTYFVFHYWDLLGSFYKKDSVQLIQGDTIIYPINY